MSNGPDQPPSTPANPPPSGPSGAPPGPGGLDSDDRMVIRVVEEFTETVEEANREQSRIVIVTAIVALVSAIAGPLVSLKINSDQIDSQRATSKEQAAALLETTANQNQLEGERGSQEFIRTERRVAYTDFLSTYNNGAVDLLEISGKYTAAGYPPARAARDLQTMIDLLKDVTRDYYTVSMVASEEARQKAGNAYGAFATVANQLIEVGGRLTSGEQLSPREAVRVNHKFQAHYQDLIAISATFIELARDDVSANQVDTASTG